MKIKENFVDRYITTTSCIPLIFFVATYIMNISKVIEEFIWFIILIINVIGLILLFKVDKKGKLSKKICWGIILAIGICCILYKVFTILSIFGV